jgi:anti-sigma factor RsiW
MSGKMGPLEHDQPDLKHIAEKYVLGELRAEERDRFEEHFFECAECAEDVRTLVHLSANVKAALADQLGRTGPAPAAAERTGWREYFQALWARPVYALCAVAALASFVSYEATSRRNGPAPQAIAGFMLRPETRGAETVIPARSGDGLVLLEADVPAASGQLSWDLRQAGSNAPMFASSAAAPGPGASLKLLIPASKLAPGEYVLSVRPADAPQPTSYRFRVSAR